MRFDLTKDKRYTLSEAAKQTISTAVDAPIIIDVFLEGDFPSEFRSVFVMKHSQILEEFAMFQIPT